MRPATTTVEDDAASVNIFCSRCFKEVFCVTFSTIFYECLFLFFQLCFIDDISTKSSLRLWFSLFILRVLLFFFQAQTEKSSSKKNRRESKKSAREHQTSLNCRTFNHSQTKMSQALSSSRVLTNASAVRCRQYYYFFPPLLCRARIWEKKKRPPCSIWGQSDVHIDEMDKSFIERDEVFRCSF